MIVYIRSSFKSASAPIELRADPEITDPTVLDYFLIKEDFFWIVRFLTKLLILLVTVFICDSC